MSTRFDCNLCGNPQVLPIEREDLIAWSKSGLFVQDYFPHLSPNDREMIMTGTCGRCFDDLFPVSEV